MQFTPDLLPAVITGTRSCRASTEEFDVELGPVLVNLLLADEVNRAPAKVPSALLEVTAERQVSIGGRTYRGVWRHRRHGRRRDAERDVSGRFVGAGLALVALAGSSSLLWSQRLP